VLSSLMQIINLIRNRGEAARWPTGQKDVDRKMGANGTGAGQEGEERKIGEKKMGNRVAAMFSFEDLKSEIWNSGGSSPTKAGTGYGPSHFVVDIDRSTPRFPTDDRNHQDDGNKN
jgi:hypothetical protein